VLLRYSVVLFGLLALAPRSASAQNLDQLLRAVQEDRPGLVARILDKQPDLAKAQDAHGETALYQAAYMNRPEEARLLITLGADPNQLTRHGTCPLLGACLQGNLEIARLLLNNGARVDIPDDEKRTPLHWAAQRGHTEVVNLLLSRKAPVDARDEDGRTPLHLASLAGWDDAVRALLSHGANPKALDFENLTPYRLAVTYQLRDWKKVVNQLAQAGGAVVEPGP
jgi:ankyrin repeat protein